MEISEIRQDGRMIDISSRKGEYKIVGKFNDGTERMISGYIYTITGEIRIYDDIWIEQVSLGITNKDPEGKPLKCWAVTIMPEGLLWRTFRVKKDFENWIYEDEEKILKYLRKVRDANR